MKDFLHTGKYIPKLTLGKSLGCVSIALQGMHDCYITGTVIIKHD